MAKRNPSAQKLARKRRRYMTRSPSWDIMEKKQASGRRAYTGDRVDGGEKTFGKYRVSYQEKAYAGDKAFVLVMGEHANGTHTYATLAGAKRAYKAINSAAKAKAWLLRNVIKSAPKKKSERRTRLERRWESPTYSQANLHENKLKRRLRAMKKWDASRILGDALQHINKRMIQYTDGAHYIEALFSKAKDARKKREYEWTMLQDALERVLDKRIYGTEAAKKLNAAIDKVMKRHDQRMAAYGHRPAKHVKKRKNPLVKSLSKKVGKWRVECKGRTVYAAGAKHAYKTPAAACAAYKKITSVRAVESFVKRYGTKKTCAAVCGKAAPKRALKKAAPKRKNPRRNAPMSASEANSIKSMLRKHGYIR